MNTPAGRRRFVRSKGVPVTAPFGASALAEISILNSQPYARALSVVSPQRNLQLWDGDPRTSLAIAASETGR